MENEAKLPGDLEEGMRVRSRADAAKPAWSKPCVRVLQVELTAHQKFARLTEGTHFNLPAGQVNHTHS